ncbi:hypothetical protein I3843_07G043700 [Carya illinoinensis]|nr:hypothetical protein I3760_09G059600 [Carya illinoinensis]KAG7969680.1 hypothetical protein I3843_07G043700 [Carya illinoinensis]
MSSAPWRGKEEAVEEFRDVKLKVTKKNDKSKRHDLKDDDSLVKIDPQLCYIFQRCYIYLPTQSKEFLITCLKMGILFYRIHRLLITCLPLLKFLQPVVKPLPPTMAYNISRNLSFFTPIFMQFFDPEGIGKAQKSLGMGQEEKARCVQ